MVHMIDMYATACLPQLNEFHKVHYGFYVRELRAETQMRKRVMVNGEVFRGNLPQVQEATEMPPV